LIDPQLRLGQSPHPHTRCAVKRTVVDHGPWAKVEQNVAKQRRHAQYTSDSNSAIKNVATKEHKRQAKALVEALESRFHGGTPIGTTELVSARDFLLQSDFSPASDYFGRLRQIQDRLRTRPAELPVRRGKRDYGGEAAGYWMQVQSSYDHVILSVCYDGEFNLKRGRVKISHRFNQQGRVDFVEAKLLRSLDPMLDGAIRKLLMIKNFQSIRKDWLEAEAFVLEILPKELIFLYDSLFRCERSEILAWLTNVGHRLVCDLLDDLCKRPLNSAPRSKSLNGDDNGQVDLIKLRTDEVAWPILARAASLASKVEIIDPKNVIVRYHGEY
jgi:hypothetical protein